MKTVRWRRVRRIRPYGCTNGEIAGACWHRTRVWLRRRVLEVPPDWGRIALQIWKLDLYEIYAGREV